MLYLINQELTELTDQIRWKQPTQQQVHDILKTAFKGESIEGGSITSGLDDLTAKIVNQLFGLKIRTIHEEPELTNCTPDDIAIGLPDNMELGDQALSIILHYGSEGTNSVEFYLYTKWEGITL